MTPKSSAILTAAALLSSQALTLAAKEAEVEIRRPLSVKNERQARGADDAVTTTPDVRQGRGADDLVTATATPDVRQGRGADDLVTATATPDVRQGRGADDLVTATTTPDARQGRGADDLATATATPDVRQGRGADDVAAVATEDRGIVATLINFVTTTLGFGTNTAAATPDVSQGRGTDDIVTTTPDVRQGRGADDIVTTTPDVRQGRGADDIVTATPDVRQGRGADDIVASTGALVPTLAAITAPAATGTQFRGQVTTEVAKAQAASTTSGRQKKVIFRASQQAQTAGLSPMAIQSSHGKNHVLNVAVKGFSKAPSTSTADLENGETIGNLPNKERLRFSLYANTQQAQAAAALWAQASAQDTREDQAVTTSETGIITWDDQSGKDSQGCIHGLFLNSDRMPELNDKFLRGKVIQIYGPQVTILDDSGTAVSSTRQVYWTSSALR